MIYFKFSVIIESWEKLLYLSRTLKIAKKMGRELRRVPLDFKWPMNQTWKGYVNPFRSMDCKSCDCTGLNPETKKIDDDWYAFDNPRWVWTSKDRRYNDKGWSHHITDIEVEALVKGGRIRELMPVKERYDFDEEAKQWLIFKDEKWAPCKKPEMPTAESVNTWNKNGMGHDGINKYICVEARAKHLGVYGVCEFCDGEGYIWQSDEIKKLNEDWKEIEPPTGDGFQLWETTSEGSPSSPVFKTLDELCEWCEDNATTFGSHKTTKEKWMQMLNNDFVTHTEGNMIFL